MLCLWLTFEVQQAIGEAEECLAGCQVTKADFIVTVSVLSSTNCMAAFGLSEK